MAANHPGLVVAVFPDLGRAEGAIDDLWHLPLAHDRIGILVPGVGITEAHTRDGRIEDRAAHGAATGAITGGAIGLLVGATVMALVPGIGPVLAGGMLAGIVTGVVGATAAGAAAGTILGSFIALGLSEEESRHYERELMVGRTIVTVRADGREAEILHLLRDHEPLELQATGEPAAAS